MMNNNKILTVSYGTFSCTLEGFDDSFGTMKAITEYFRDLASDDRYFGSEPVQPDASMLAKIAQKEISRHVEAREHEGNIVLSAAQDDSYLATGAAATATAISLAPDAKADEAHSANDNAEDIDASVSQAPMPEEDTQVPVEETPTEVEVAVEQKTVVVEETDVKTAQPDVIAQDAPTQVGAPANEDYIEAQDNGFEADPSIAVLRRAQATAAPLSQVDDVDIVPDRDDAAVSSFFAQNDAAEDIYEGTVEETAFENAVNETAEDNDLADEGDTDTSEPVAFDAPEVDFPEVAKTESIADKLRRIRQVVSQSADEDGAADTQEIVSDHIEQDDDAVSAEFDEDRDSQTGEDDLISSALRDIKGAMAEDDQTTSEVQVEQAEETLEADEDLTSILDRLKTDDQDDAAEDDLDVASDIDAEQADDALEDESEPELDATALAVAAAAARQEAPAEPRRGRVIKVKRVDLEAAINKGDLEEYENKPERASSLSAEEEAELADELAELEADLELDDGAQQDEVAEQLDAKEGSELADSLDAEEAEVEDAATAAREALPSLDDAQNPDMNRLMAETDQQMSEPENETRRNAFAHLRAAVAARKADAGLSKDQDDAAEGEAYREDLAEVVRPRRPVTGEQRTPRPSNSRPAPLKLVAEQRIDDGKPAAVTPVRPRRVAAVQEETEVHVEESFAEFAAEAGATSLPDLLEAAAAYMSFVEGRAQFSRPQLMNKVRQVEENGFTREDSLRLFGKLLREGKIEKTNAGRFQVSDLIGFKPDARAVG